MNYIFSEAWWLAMLLDYVIDVFFLADFIGRYYDIYASSPTPMSFTKAEISKREVYYEIFLCIPFELVALGATHVKYLYLLRITKLCRLAQFSAYWKGVSLVLDGHINSVSGQRVVFFLLMMLIASHISACVHYGIAYILCFGKDKPVYDNMLTHNGKLASIDDETGEISLVHSVTYNYLRFLYYTVNVIVSRINYLVADACVSDDVFVIRKLWASATLFPGLHQS
jgi:hypothetical protein